MIHDLLQRIGPGKTVTLHFSVSLADGDVVDSTFDERPATFTVGDGKLAARFRESAFRFEGR